MSNNSMNIYIFKILINYLNNSFILGMEGKGKKKGKRKGSQWY